jgi:hypothetical protein
MEKRCSKGRGRDMETRRLGDRIETGTRGLGEKEQGEKETG